ncbi:MAG TPA: RsmE family RNA methyltransferase, partial [Thermoanaerobaculia bacterium]|nr:RsmE family RNA methyltransferase [Thermoanaerobaculia bacterium]
MITVLVDPGPFAGAELELGGVSYRHLFRARRLPAGETLRVADGQGHARWGEVARVDRASALIALGAPAPANEAPLRLDLLVAPPRPERAAWLVEKATEAGVSAIRFLNTERAPRSPGPATLARLRRIASAALEQCHRSRLPDLTGPHPWSGLDSLAAAHPARFFLDPAAPTPALSLAAH